MYSFPSCLKIKSCRYYNLHTKQHITITLNIYFNKYKWKTNELEIPMALWAIIVAVAVQYVGIGMNLINTKVLNKIGFKITPTTILLNNNKQVSIAMQTHFATRFCLYHLELDHVHGINN